MHRYAQPLTSPEEAAAFLAMLHDEDRSFHLDDPPATIVDMAGNFIFTAEEAAMLDLRMHEVFEQLADPYDFVLSLWSGAHK